MAYDPRPSQTRRGQRVDNPPVRDTDTAELKALVEEQTQDDRFQQNRINAMVHTKLAVNDRRWVEYDEAKGNLPTKSDIAHIWMALAAVGSIFMLCLAVLLAKVFKTGGP